MLLAIFLVGIVIYAIACKAEDLQREKEMENLKRGNRLIKKLLNGTKIDLN